MTFPLAGELIPAAALQDSSEHAAVIRESRTDVDLTEIYLPIDTRRRADTEPGTAEVLKRSFVIFKSAYRELDSSLEKGNTLVHYFRVTDIGGLLRITRYVSESRKDSYYFIPGGDFEEQVKNLLRIYEAEDIPIDSRRTLIRWAQVARASLGL